VEVKRIQGAAASDLRAGLGARIAANRIRLLWLLARALREHPRLNASLQGEEIQVWRRANIGLAFDSEQKAPDGRARGYPIRSRIRLAVLREVTNPRFDA